MTLRSFFFRKIKLLYSKGGGGGNYSASKNDPRSLFHGDHYCMLHRTWWRRVERNHPMNLWSGDEFLDMELVQLQPLNGNIKAERYQTLLNDNVWPVISHNFPNQQYIIQDDNAPLYRVCLT